MLPAIDWSPAGILSISSRRAQQETQNLYHSWSNSEPPVILCLIVSFIIHGVWEQNATPLKLGVMEPLRKAVSPSMVANNVDFPDATDPTIAVKPGRIFKFNLWRIISGESPDQQISAPFKVMIAASGEFEEIFPSCIECSEDSEGGDGRKSGINNRFLKRYFSIRVKHATPCIKDGNAVQRTLSE